ncbi:MAG: hypothetical protein KDE59_14405, partial [Anaerolineales bacterium]|nr:hypothetical protein [Anaerolineales bacterium]
KLPGSDPRLGPEMRSTGEVMGHAARFGHAFAKSQMAAGTALPEKGGVLITVNDFDKAAALKLARDLDKMGFTLYATAGTAAALERMGITAIRVAKASEGSGEQADTLDIIEDGRVQMIINTPLGESAQSDGNSLRQAAIKHKVLLLTTLSAAQAAVNGMIMRRKEAYSIRSLQTHHGMAN